MCSLHNIGKDRATHTNPQNHDKVRPPTPQEITLPVVIRDRVYHEWGEQKRTRTYFAQFLAIVPAYQRVGFGRVDF
jgi:hypothetical protein